MSKLLFFGFLIMPYMLTATPLIIGHRGTRGYEPENTLRAFERAIAMGVNMIELDVYVCKTGEVVVIHDATVNRTTNGKGEVEQLSWSILKNLDAGKGEHIPLLSQVFDAVNKRVGIIIELKLANTAKPVADLIKQYVQTKGWAYDNFIVISFDHYAVKEFKTYCPEVKTGVLFEGNPIDLAGIAERADASYAVMYYESLMPALIADAHKRGIKVFTYTINDTALAKKLQKMNVDGIITDYPDILTLKRTE